MSQGRTLVIQTAHLGDVVLTLPLIMQLGERYGPVDLLTTPAAAGLAAGHPAIRRVIPFDKHRSGRGLAGLVAMASGLRRERYARAFLPHRSGRSALVALFAGIPERIGFAGRVPALTYTTRIGYPADGHQVRRLALLAGAAGQAAGPSPGAHWLSLAEEDRRAADGWLSASGLGSPFIVLAPGSRWGTKRWPGYADLAARLPDRIAVIGGPEDAEEARAIVSRDPGRIRSAVGDLGLRATAALIERATLLVTNDSLPLHFASALDRPVVAIFGPTVTRFGFGPLSSRAVVIEHPDLACRPCSPHGPMACPLGHHRCMSDLDIARVAAAVEGLRV